MEEDLRLNESVDALNAWSAGDARRVFRPGPRPLARIAEGSRLQRQTLTGLLEDLRNFREGEIMADSESDAEAFRALMRKSWERYGERQDLGKLGEGEPSLPPPGAKGVRHEGCLPANEKKLVVDPTAGLVTGQPSEVDPALLYGAPALYKDGVSYAGFVQQMLASGLVELRPGNLGPTVKVFFVKKTGGRLRAVIDCWGVNAICAELPKTRLDSVQSVTGIGVPDGETLCSPAIRKAVRNCAAAGGCTLMFAGPGTYL